MEIVKKTIDSLIFAEYNPRQLTDEQYQRLKDSITRFGLVDPIIVNQHKDRKNIIVGGHQRTRVAKKLGIEEVPCVFVNLPYEKERELNVRLNKNTGGWDYDILADMFDLDELIDWGFKEEELVGFDADIEVEGKIDDDEIPEDVESVCKLGDIWELGNHRLLCGDSTVKENIELLLDGNKADMVFTDPPYGMNLDTDYSSMKSKLFKGKTGADYHKPIIGDNVDFNPAFFLNYFHYCKEQFWWGGDYYAEYLPKGSSWVVWDKRLDDSADKMYGSCFELCWSKTKHKRDIARIKWAGIFGTDKEFDKKRHHPTQKPIDLVLWFFERYKGNKVVDIFLGSGSTLIACEKTKRVCYGMELDPHYCDVIINRWEQYTGKKARLVNGST
tara:strand:+ start:16879 stop:18036 length:1158 start_codon:yes stop_codon:yes gene_type:complete